MVIGNRDGGAYGLRYRLRTDADWRVRSVRVTVMGGAELRLLADGTEIAALSGCIDVDIAATPFTNTLPIRRLGLSQGQPPDIRAAYVRLLADRAEPADQRYTRPGSRRYLYEGLIRGYLAELATDDAGLVLDYPDTSRRLGG